MPIYSATTASERDAARRKLVCKTGCDTVWRIVTGEIVDPVTKEKVAPSVADGFYGRLLEGLKFQGLVDECRLIIEWRRKALFGVLKYEEVIFP